MHAGQARACFRASAVNFSVLCRGKHLLSVARCLKLQVVEILTHEPREALNVVWKAVGQRPMTRCHVGAEGQEPGGAIFNIQHGTRVTSRFLP